MTVICFVYQNSAAQAAQIFYLEYCLNNGKSWLSCLTKVLMIPLLPAEVSYSDSSLASGQFINRQFDTPCQNKTVRVMWAQHIPMSACLA